MSDRETRAHTDDSTAPQPPSASVPVGLIWPASSQGSSASVVTTVRWLLTALRLSRDRPSRTDPAAQNRSLGGLCADLHAPA